MFVNKFNYKAPIMKKIIAFITLIFISYFSLKHYQNQKIKTQIELQLKAKADKRRFNRNIIISSIYSLINLPSTILNFLTKINQYSEYNRVLAEIEVMQEEINKYNTPQINKRRDDA